MGKVVAPGAAAITGVALLQASPTVAWSALENMPVSAREEILSDALDKRYIHGKFTRHVADDAAFEIGTRNIYLPDKASPAVVAHELGHGMASELRKATIGSTAARHAYDLGRVAALTIPMFALLGWRDPSFATEQELRNRARFVSAVGVGAGLAQAPVLAEEAAASIEGAKLLRAVGATEQEVLEQVGKKLLPAFATYAAPAAIPFAVAAYLGHKARQARRNRRG